MANLFINGRIYQGGHPGPTFAQCMLIQDGIIQHVGSEQDEPILSARRDSSLTAVTDLAGQTVLPGFIDGHVHLLMLGQALTKLDLRGCSSIHDIRARIAQYAQANPDTPRIFCKGWQSNAMTPEGADASMLDGLDERPIFVDSQCLHSCWASSAGVRDVCAVMGIADDAADPPGGTFSRDGAGKLSGLFSEAAVYDFIWPFVARVASMQERVDAIASAVRALNTAGCTGIVEMAMDETIWEALLELRGGKRDDGLGLGLGAMRIAAYWLMKPNDSLEHLMAQVDRAAELAKEWNAERGLDLRVVGIKVICDGTVDSCTASLREPYFSSSSSSGAGATNNNPDPTWKAEVLNAVVARAHSRGLQVALHAIGDRTVKMAIDVLEQSTSASLRPRIEHLELTSEEDAARLGKLGITASIQPVHSDPAVLRAWPRLIGPHRCDRAFAYGDFARGGAVLAMGSDAPTAPYPALPNMYVATTRCSHREPGLEATAAIGKPEFKLSVCEAVAAATEGSAYSTFAEGWSGSLRAGLKADFVVCELDLDLAAPEELAKGVVRQTWFEGKRVYQK